MKIGQIWEKFHHALSTKRELGPSHPVTAAAMDTEISERFLNLAKAYRSQADVLKAKKESGKKRR